MSDNLGPVSFSRGELHPFLGRELAEQKNFSEITARLIDEEIQKIVRNMEKKQRTSCKKTTINWMSWPMPCWNTRACQGKK